MRFIKSFELLPLLDTSISLLTAFVLGILIGAERQYRQRTAGLRTNVLVAVGAAAFVDLAQRVAGDTAAVQIIAYVVSGIGFLGAGVIMQEGVNVRGLNTAATLWCSAAVGACAGSDRVAEAALLTAFVLAGNTLLRPLANAINRIPIDERAAEATYEVRLTTTRSQANPLRDMLVEKLEGAQYPVADLDVIDRDDESVDIVATLVSTAVDPTEIDAVTAALQREPGVSHATWESSTQD
jgi:putative Mg2+ transporter-C (MgtC) family protein